MEALKAAALPNIYECATDNPDDNKTADLEQTSVQSRNADHPYEDLDHSEPQYVNDPETLYVNVHI